MLIQFTGSREQNFRPKDCGICHAWLTVRPGKGFWEGGQGELLFLYQFYVWPLPDSAGCLAILLCTPNTAISPATLNWDVGNESHMATQLGAPKMPGGKLPDTLL